MSGSPEWGSGIGRRNPQSLGLWRPVGLECRSSTGLGEAEIPLLEGAHTVSHALGLRAKQWLHQSLGQTYLQVLEHLLGRQRLVVAHYGGKDTVQRPQGRLIGMSSLGGCHFSTKTWPHPTACRLQCWDTSGQTTNQHSGNTAPTHQKDRLTKIVLIL